MIKISRHDINFVRYVKPSQIFARLWLTAKRHTLVHAAQVLPRLRGLRVGDPEPLQDRLPQPVFAPRQFCVAQPDGAYEMEFLNRRRRMRVPLSWRDRRHDVSTWLWDLHLNYMEFLESLDDCAFATIVRDWIASNPPYAAGYWRDNWNSYALSIRCVVWMQQFAARRARLDVDLQRAMIVSLWKQMNFLTNNLERDILGNHLIKNIKALLWAGRFFTGPQARWWHALGERLLSEQISDQILGDGMHYERSPAYHNQVFADLIECLTVVEPGPIHEALTAALARMAQVTADLRHPDGLVPLFNDAGLTSAYAPEACLEAYTHTTGYKVEPRRQIHLPDAGYFGIRSDDMLFLADCGAIAPDFLVAHGHGDMLSFEWSVAGRRIIVDQGVYEYSPGARRQASRSTLSHNTVSIQDAEQCDFIGSFRCGRRARARVLSYEGADGGLALTGTHTGFEHLPGGAAHARTFTVSAGRIVIDDRITYGEGPQRATARFLLHPDCAVRVHGAETRISCGDVVIVATFEKEPQVEPAEWWPDMGAAYPTRRLVLILDGASAHRSVLEVEATPR